jgi:hypothetical protein
MRQLGAASRLTIIRRHHLDRCLDAAAANWWPSGGPVVAVSKRLAS